MEKKSKTVAKVLTFSLLLLVLCIMAHPKTLAQTLTLTIYTDKNTYNLGETVTIFGNLTKNGQPITDGLVGIQVIMPSGKTLLIRSLQTFPYQTRYCPIYVWSVTPCDEWGNPKYTFERESNAYFKITLTNFSSETLTPLVTVVLFDTNNISLGYASARFQIPPDKQTYTLTLWIPIPADATLGTATVYSSAFTEWPQFNGTPYCPEKSNTLQIISKSQAALIQSEVETATSDTNGSYSMTFRLHSFSETGAYTIYATSQYDEEAVTETKGFLAGVKGDINEDGSVDSSDLGLLGIAWGSTLGEPNYSPKADLNEDGVIDSSDLGIMGMYWGYTSG